MSTTIQYNPRDATLLGRSFAETRLGQVQHELEEEFKLALALAAEYAVHLAAGGDPTDYPKTGGDADGRRGHGLVRVAREGVFDAWNGSRDRQSVSYPWGQGMPFRWLVQEYLLDRLGQPVPLTELMALTQGGVVVRGGLKPSPQTVADAAWSLQVATQGRVRVRKVRVGGKVAWLARLPVTDDDLADLTCREGVYRSSDQLSEAERADALTRPFRHQVYEYPQEVL